MIIQILYIYRMELAYSELTSRNVANMSIMKNPMLVSTIWLVVHLVLPPDHFTKFK